MPVVPFGKYKGRPVEDMLADADYMGWLEAQPWFRDKFAHLRNGTDDQASRTPVHNRLQSLFLDTDYCVAFALVAQPGQVQAISERPAANIARNIKACEGAIAYNEQQLETYAKDMSSLRSSWAKTTEKRLAAWIKTRDALRSMKIRKTAGSMFECKGADVQITLAWFWDCVSGSEYSDPELWEDCVRWEARVEIKPVVADDYPAVLRQMGRHHTHYLFVGEYIGEGATESQFVEIFSRSGIRVVFKRDVDAKASERS